MAHMQTVPFTRADLARIPEDLRVELIEGELVKMIVPSMRHQVMAKRLFQALVDAVGWERVFFTGTGVIIDDYSVLVPDVVVLPEDVAAAPEDMSDQYGVTRAQLVVEVLSPSTERRDRTQKKKLYLQSGVEELWLVDPKREQIEIHTALGSTVYEGATVARSGAIPAFQVEPSMLFRA